MIPHAIRVLFVLLSATAALAQPFGRACVCDCDADAAVTVDELITLTNLALGTSPIHSCLSSDIDGSGVVDVAEVLHCVQPALYGCPVETRADAAFWETLGAVAQRDAESIALHQQAIDENPQDSRSWFLLGMMHFYRYGTLLSSYDEFSEAAKAEITLASAALDRAVELDSISRTYPGFRGAATYQHGLAHGDTARIELGLEQLRQSIELWPFFNRFSFLGTVAAVAPVGDPLFDEAVQYLLDSTNSLSECTAQLCGNAGKAPSNLAGTALLFGDIFAKADAFDPAVGWYSIGAASAGPEYPFAHLFSERIENAAERIALYRDADPTNDPPLVGLGGQNCVTCHAR